MKHKILLFSALITLGTSVQAQYTTMVTENFTSCASLNANILDYLSGGPDNPENVPVISCSVDVVCISY